MTVGLVPAFPSHCPGNGTPSPSIPGRERRPLFAPGMRIVCTFSSGRRTVSPSFHGSACHPPSHREWYAALVLLCPRDRRLTPLVPGRRHTALPIPRRGRFITPIPRRRDIISPSLGKTLPPLRPLEWHAIPPSVLMRRSAPPPFPGGALSLLHPRRECCTTSISGRGTAPLSL